MAFFSPWNLMTCLPLQWETIKATSRDTYISLVQPWRENKSSDAFSELPEVQIKILK